MNMRLTGTIAFLLIIQSNSVLGRTSYGFNKEPEFAEPVRNMTVAVGRAAQLLCVVDNLGTYRVAWLRVESKTILTIHQNVITRNYRVNLSHSDHKNWILHIRDVQESDRGGYMCQINTVPMKSQVGYLDVFVPPEIIGAESSSDVMVREGFNVTLTCRSKGYPTPTITWRREDGEPLAVGNWQNNIIQVSEFVEDQSLSEKVLKGAQLNITKVSRLHMGAYLCIASNGVPPSVSHRIILQVHFPPLIWIPHQLVGALLGSDITLECHTEAFPTPINYWTKEDGAMIVSNMKYTCGTVEESYKIYMKLTIRNVEPDDYGKYRCFAKNSLGETEGSIRLYEIHLSSQDEGELSTSFLQSINGKKQWINNLTVGKPTFSVEGGADNRRGGKFNDHTRKNDRNSSSSSPELPGRFRKDQFILVIINGLLLGAYSLLHFELFAIR
ncbi:lachesin-like isoform X1 [Tachypleus tridentatus]|uniref:lachesin-like isoform X1 n=1 Tax=Tachypleus tridentatus TaxID=6853 RepID=UPI003FD6BBC7